MQQLSLAPFALRFVRGALAIARVPVALIVVHTNPEQWLCELDCSVAKLLLSSQT